MYGLMLTMRLQSPVLITEIGGGDPNSGVGMRKIPGSSLRGALVGRYCANHQPRADDAEFRRLFLDDGVYFLNAYPQSSRSARMLPTPLSWRREKNAAERDSIFDFAAQVQNEPETTWKGITSEYASLNGAETELHDPAMQITIHTARESRQKVTTGQATVFRYDALAEGQTFVGAILAQQEQTLHKLTELLSESGRLSIGRSQSAGYGRIEIENVVPISDARQAWEFPQQSAPGAGQRIIVTLLSDALVRNPQTGNHVMSLKPILLKEHYAAFVRTQPVAGFNRTWNLPLVQQWALAAGSVFVYDYDPALAEQLRNLTVSGIGERRVEGFGRIAVNWQGVATISVQKPVHKEPNEVALSDASHTLAHTMAERMLRAELDQRLLAAVNRLAEGAVRNGLQNAQISRVRVIMRQALHARSDLSNLSNYLSDLRQTARQQLQRARIDGIPMAQWLIGLAQDPTQAWYYLDAEHLQSPSIGELRLSPTNEMAVEYAAHLIDAVAKRMVDEAKREPTQEVNHG